MIMKNGILYSRTNFQSVRKMKNSVFTNHGFTLIETLTAMMILAISLVSIFQLFSGGLNSERLAENYTHAIFHAREKMEEILLYREMADGEFEGDFGDGFRWKAAVSAIISDETDKDSGVPEEPNHLFHVSVSVFWDAGERERSYEISTVNMARKISDEKKG